MLSFFRQWALGVCLAALTGAIVYAVSPQGAVKKALRTAVAAAVMCAIVLPFAKAGLDIDFDLSETDTSAVVSSELESAVEYQLTAAYADAVVSRADSILRESGQPECEITVVTDINEDGSIFIKRADIRLSDKNKAVDSEARAGLAELFGEDAVIVFS